MKKTNRTFIQILAAVAEPNMQMLITRARTANRLAKTTEIAGTKRRAYWVKVNALSGLKLNFPDKVKVVQDWKHGSGIVLIEISDRGFGLHAPAADFGLEF